MKKVLFDLIALGYVVEIQQVNYNQIWVRISKNGYICEQVSNEDHFDDEGSYFKELTDFMTDKIHDLNVNNG